MAIPLMMLGPGGDFTTRYHVKGLGLVRGTAATLEQQPDTETAGSMAGWDRFPEGQDGQDQQQESGAEAGRRQGRQSDRFEHTRSAEPAGTYTPLGRQAGAAADTAVLGALLAWLSEQQRELAQQREQSVLWEQTLARTDRLRFPAAEQASTSAHTQQASIALVGKESSVESHTESHPQAAQNPDAHPRLSIGAWLFADDAGARRRAARQQSHGLRTRRSADSQRRLDPAGQQSSLFGT